MSASSGPLRSSRESRSSTHGTACPPSSSPASSSAQARIPQRSHPLTLTQRPCSQGRPQRSHSPLRC
eukprot:15435990-Alexandrium_andersonii.AAC.1